MTTDTTHLTWTPDLGDAAPTHAEWMRIALVAETILEIHVRRAYAGALSVALRPPTPTPYKGYGLHGRDPLSGDWAHLPATFDVPIPDPATPSQRRWHRHMGEDAPTSLRGLLAFVLRQAQAEVAGLRDLPVSVTLTRDDLEALQLCVRLSRSGGAGDPPADMAQQILDPWRQLLDATRDEAPQRCSTCGSADLHVTAYLAARGGAVVGTGWEAPLEAVWCERCQEHDS